MPLKTNVGRFNRHIERRTCTAPLTRVFAGSPKLLIVGSFCFDLNFRTWSLGERQAGRLETLYLPKEELGWLIQTALCKRIAVISGNMHAARHCTRVGFLPANC